MRNIVKLWIFLLIVSFVVFSCYQYDNPIDPEATNYQGYTVVSSINEVTADTPSEGYGAVWLVFKAAKVLGGIADIYHFQISESNDFSGSLVYEKADNDSNILTIKTSDSCNVTNGKTYYWRVRAHKTGGDWGIWSSAVSFTASSGVSSEGISPENGKVTGITPLLDWTDVEGAVSYQVQIADSETGLATATVIDTNTSSYKVTSALSENTTYYWRVRSVNSDGVVGPWSSVWSFKTFGVSSINSLLEEKGLSMRVVKIIDYGTTDTYREMTLTSYALSETEVTQGDYEIVMGSNPADDYGVGSNYPVYYVDWYDAVRFCNALSVLVGLEPVYDEDTWEADFSKNGFYLPTETQWEYAAGGPNHYRWSLGDTFNASDYVFDDTQTRPVKSHPANGFGLYDMSGNVWEWCNGWYGDTYPHSGETDPVGPSSGSLRCGRGGSWNSFYSSSLECDYRSSAYPGTSSSLRGFRIAVGGFGHWN